MNGEIHLISGTLGGGKTLYAVERIAWHLYKGGHVFTNIEMLPDAVAAWLASKGRQFDPARLHVILEADVKKFHEVVYRGHPDLRVMVVIDEAGLNLNARDWKDLNRDLLNFNVLVRKFDILMLYISQKPEMLDKQIRNLVQTQIDCRNFRHYKIMGLFSVPLSILFRVHMICTWGQKAKSHTETCLAPRWAFRLYNSDALLGAAAGKFASMTRVSPTPLSRIKRVPLPRDYPIHWPEIIVSLCAALFTCF